MKYGKEEIYNLIMIMGKNADFSKNLKNLKKLKILISNFFKQKYRIFYSLQEKIYDDKIFWSEGLSKKVIKGY